MFYYVTILTFIVLSPLNLPVEEKAVTGPFPDKYLCNLHRVQVEETINQVPTARLKTSKCIKKVKI